MKKIIEITNEPSFNKGIITYVCDFNLGKSQYEYGYMTSPKKQCAMDFSLYDSEYINKCMFYIKRSFDKADVKMIDAD